MILICCSQNYE